MTPPSDHAGAVLTINLDAIVRNYRQLDERLGKTACAAVVKADAYGLGIAPVARALAGAGCASFFVATIEEGIELRGILPEAEIAVLNGAPAEAVGEVARHGLIPVLNGPDQIEAWRADIERAGARPAILHCDTGMARLGLTQSELEAFCAAGAEGIPFRCVMSHLACADDPAHPLNGEQLALFQDARARLERRFGPSPASLANSSGIFLGPAYHFDLARPGVALYGVNPTPGQPNPMAEAIQLKGKIIGLREIDRAMTVGYGATHRVTRGSRIATVAVGYADGFLRSLSNRAYGYIGTARVKMVGRVSMDLTTFDVSALPPEDARPGTMVTLIGREHPIDALAAEAGTIGYEVLTSLGRRYRRRYVGG
jgi:alanine racemase